jgi:hypothetical protein
MGGMAGGIVESWMREICPFAAEGGKPMLYPYTSMNEVFFLADFNH